MKTRVRELCGAAERQFAARQSLLSQWQDIAEHFYPERADFISQRAPGDELASGLMTGYPSMCRRDLGNTFSGMLRPRGKLWGSIQMMDERLNEQPRIRQATEWLTRRMWRVMYDPRAQFTRATKEGDHDFAAFGQCAIEKRMNRDRSGLFFRCYHLRDTAWTENAELAVDCVYVKWCASARQVVAMFPQTAPTEVRDMMAKEPEGRVECMRIIMPADDYDSYGVTDEQKRRGPAKGPLVSIWVDRDHDTILEEVRMWENPFTIPRWQTVAGSQYAHSPATVIAVPDARLLQRMTLTLLEANEKAVDPPLIATAEVVRGDIQIFPGGITTVDREYDETHGAALRALEQDFRGVAAGREMLEEVRNQINAAFYLNQITLPPAGDDMTAYEVQERVSEYVRRALPLFEPMEAEYNGKLCEGIFMEMWRNGFFGPPQDLPQEFLSGEFKFVFESPMQAATERSKAVAFKESAELLAMAAQVDRDALDVIDVGKALTDALRGVQAPATWVRSEEERQARAEERAQAMQAMEAAQAVSAGADIAGKVGGAAQQLQAAGLA